MRRRSSPSEAIGKLLAAAIPPLQWAQTVHQMGDDMRGAGWVVRNDLTPHGVLLRDGVLRRGGVLRDWIGHALLRPRGRGQPNELRTYV